MSPAVAIIICTHTTERLDLLTRAVTECRAQMIDADQLLVVADGPEALTQSVKLRLGPEVRVVPNARTPGLSGARNTALSQTDRPVLVFLDDDALPDANWLDRLRRHFDQSMARIIGGAVIPDWAGRDSAPTWFPEEFWWTVGCDYAGMPADDGPIRNPIGANMAIGRVVFEVAGGFNEALGRRGSALAGCEETEFSIRARHCLDTTRPVRESRARVYHLVPQHRQRPAYVLRRCFDEGRSKAALRRLTNAAKAFGPESRHAFVTLPLAWWRELVTSPPSRSIPSILMSVAGLASAVSGFIVGSFTARTTS